MGAYALRRLLWVPVTVILTSMIVFPPGSFYPGNVIDVIQAQNGSTKWRHN